MLKIYTNRFSDFTRKEYNVIRPYSRVLAMIATSMFLATLAGCGGGDSGPTSPPTPEPSPPAPPPAPVATSIAVTPASHTLATIGATVQLSATVRDQNNNLMTGQTVTWNSSNTGVATVSGNGLVTAVANGTSRITARSGNASGTANITVAEPVPTRIAISPSSHTLEMAGATVQLSATVRDQRNNIMSGQTITWSSGDEAVATVSGDGLVTAVSNGMTEITARSGSLSATAEITVAVPVATSLTIEPAEHTLAAIGDTLQLAAVVLDQHDNAMADATVTWSSGDEAVATVDENGLVTAVDNGMAEITAQAGDAMGTAAITVAQVPAAVVIEVDAEATTLTAIGQTLQLMATVSDANDHPIADAEVTWSSGDEMVVTVDMDGLVEAVGNGMTDVMAAFGDVSDMVSITVMVPSEPVATTVTIEPAEHTLEAVGQTVQLAAVVLDQHGNAMEDEAVTWSSGDEAVATVDEDGLVTAVDNGMAEITAASGDAMGTAAITVAQVPAVVVIEVDPEATTLTEIGQNLQLMATVSDANENPIADADVTWTSGDEMVVTVDMDGLVEAVGNGMTDVMAASGDVSDMVSITVMAPSDGDDGDMIEYVAWEGVTVDRGKLIFTSSLSGTEVTGCFTKDRIIVTFAGPFPPEGIKDWTNRLTMDTLTVHYSAWQRRADMDSPWNEIPDTRVEYDACAYDPDVAGEYRLVGDITLNGEREFRRSENTFTIP